ncbi:DedA family protein [Kitasatospora sp. DSM 101779]|uniref:DedA family protein n=1 Tax=Kitasatospora sp. DSM 101779 TaxID=2853165 RepID=UPI0021DB2AFA|nr:VTT domain-containing protein [Kitasatospora sp. DSM 101779]MCU7826580.1 VTT domain-containing protein [Kitasatospora sp. DSM 101779]
MIAAAALAALAADSGTTESVGFPALFLLVALGSLVPVFPTSILVSATAAAAVHTSAVPRDLVLVVVCAGLGAWCGDVTLYRLAGQAGGRLEARIRPRFDNPRVQEAERRLDEHGRAVLVPSRLVPGGRIFMIAACILSGWPVRRFAVAEAPAALLWATAYALIGALGGALFDQTWMGVLAAVGLVLLVGGATLLWRRRRRARTVATTPDALPGGTHPDEAHPGGADPSDGADDADDADDDR